MKMQDITFGEYQWWMDKWKNNNDFREITIQNEVIKPFVQSICSELDVIDVSHKGPKSDVHDYLKYSGTYLDKNGKKKPTTPDLVVADGWNWKNKENKVKYLFTIEVKSPFLDDCIYKKDTILDEIQIERHLSAEENNKVVLTDGIKWVFYKGTIKNPKIFCLYEKNDIGEWKWESNDNTFSELKEYIKLFATEEINVLSDKKIEDRYFTIPINVAISKEGIQWNYFSEMQKKENDRTETFLYEKQMKAGDHVLLYITQKGLEQIKPTEVGYNNQPGVYAIGRILASPPKKMDDTKDRNRGSMIIQVDIEYYNLNKPLEKFPDIVKPNCPGGEPFLIKNPDKSFFDKIKKAKSNAQYKPFI